MKIGNYDIYPIETGTFKLDGGSMFGIIPKVLWEKTNKADERNRIKLSARCLLIVGNGKIVLMDDGNGTKVTQKFIDIYELDTTNNLYSSLKKYGVKPADITDVILSHLHFDHAGGSTIKDKGVIKPAFPNAIYHVQRTQWENALNPTERDKASYIPDDYMPLKDFGLLNLIDGDIEIFSQISVCVSNGHSPGLQLLKISDGKKTLFYAADLMPCTSHVPLSYIMGFDLNPLITLEDKKKFLKRAVDENWIIFFEHDPDTIAGKIKRTEKGYMFDSPVEFV
ncbi:MAG: MBL fold metallo-hydrolase [Ignavibacteriales bacterium]|nr:MBL fold metallo-hydrolase [Ignavibacteriales bacterium]